MNLGFSGPFSHLYNRDDGTHPTASQNFLWLHEVIGDYGLGDSSLRWEQEDHASSLRPPGAWRNPTDPKANQTMHGIAFSGGLGLKKELQVQKARCLFFAFPVESK